MNLIQGRTGTTKDSHQRDQLASSIVMEPVLPVLQKKIFLNCITKGEMLDVHQPCHWAAIQYSCIIFIAKFFILFYFQS